jgi:hypothetical protein
MLTVELLMLNAAPVSCTRSLQLKMVAFCTPLMLSDTMSLMLMVGSRKIPADSEMFEAFMTCTA